MYCLEAYLHGYTQILLKYYIKHDIKSIEITIVTILENTVSKIKQVLFVCKYSLFSQSYSQI